jgi:hypothetical protein
LVRGTARLCAGGLDVRPVAGSHMSIVMDERAAAALAESIEAALEAAGPRLRPAAVESGPPDDGPAVPATDVRRRTATQR